MAFSLKFSVFLKFSLFILSYLYINHIIINIICAYYRRDIYNCTVKKLYLNLKYNLYNDNKHNKNNFNIYMIKKYKIQTFHEA